MEGKNLLVGMLLLSLLAFAGGCVCDYAIDDDQSAAPDDDYIGGGDDVLDDDVSDDDGTDNDVVDDDSGDDDGTDDDGADDDGTDDDGTDDDSFDDDTLDDDSFDDDTGDDDTSDDDGTDDDATDDDTVSFCDHNINALWCYDFDQNTMYAQPHDWSCSSDCIFAVYPAPPPPYNRALKFTGSNQWISYSWNDTSPYTKPFHLDFEVNYSDHRTSRFVLSANGSAVRITATSHVVDVFAEVPINPDMEWTHCGSFPADEWHTLTLVVNHPNKVQALLIDHQVTPCAGLALSLPTGFMITVPREKTGTGMFDNFLAYRPGPGPSDDDSVDDDMTDQIYEWVDGDSEYSVTGDVSMLPAADGTVHYLFHKDNYDGNWHLPYLTFYEATTVGGVTTVSLPIAVGNGWYGKSWADGKWFYPPSYEYDYTDRGVTSSLASTPDGRLYYLYNDRNGHEHDDLYDNVDSYSGGLRGMYADDAVVTIDEHTSTSSSAAQLNGFYNSAKADSLGVIHVAYNRRDASTGTFALAYKNSNDWGAAPVLIDETCTSITGVTMLADSSDNLSIGYSCDTDTNKVAALSDEGWQVQTIASGSPAAFALDSHGRLHAVFADGATLMYGVGPTIGEPYQWNYTAIGAVGSSLAWLTLLVDSKDRLRMFFTDDATENIHFLVRDSATGGWAAYELPLPGRGADSLVAALDANDMIHLGVVSDHRLWHLAFDPYHIPAAE